MKNNFSFGAIVGYLSGFIILLNAFSILGQGTSAIHQIYEILSFGFGFSLIVLGSIAQHTKNTISENQPTASTTIQKGEKV